LEWSLLSATKASLSPNFAIETSAASLISVGPSSMAAALFNADINEFMIPLSEISAECASYWFNISIAYPTWDAEL
jgi:hypothetical protein